MKTLRIIHKGIIGLFLLLILSFSFGNIKVAAQDYHGAAHHARKNTASDCQTNCRSLATVTALPQKEADDPEKEPQPGPTGEFFVDRFNFVEVKKLSSRPGRDSRLLRPPDILAMNCLYRL